MDREGIFRAGLYGCLATMTLLTPVKQAVGEAIVLQELRGPLTWYRESWSPGTAGPEKALEVEASRGLELGLANRGDWSGSFGAGFALPAWPSGVTVQERRVGGAATDAVARANALSGSAGPRTATINPPWIAWEDTQAYGDPLPEPSSLLLSSFAVLGLAGYQWRRARRVRLESSRVSHFARSM